MYGFYFIVLCVLYVINEGTLVASTVIRTPENTDIQVGPLPHRHREYDNSSVSSYSLSYDNNEGNVFAQRKDGSIYDHSYINKENAYNKQQTKKEGGHLVDWDGDSNKNVYDYNKQASDKESKNDSTITGHKDIMAAGSDSIKLPNGTVPASHQIYNHSTGRISKITSFKDSGKLQQIAKGNITYSQNYEHGVDDDKNKNYKHLQGDQTIVDSQGNFSNNTYKQSSGSETGKHKVSHKGSIDTDEKARTQSIQNGH